MQFNVCGLLVLLIQKSSPFFLSLWSSVSLSIPMLQSSWLSITGRRNGGVWGKWWRLHTHTQFLFCSLCCFLICCTFWCFAFLHFFLTLLLSCQTDFNFNLLGLLLLRSWSMRAVKWLMIVWDCRPGLLLSFQKGFIFSVLKGKHSIKWDEGIKGIRKKLCNLNTCTDSRKVKLCKIKGAPRYLNFLWLN